MVVGRAAVRVGPAQEPERLFIWAPISAELVLVSPNLSPHNLISTCRLFWKLTCYHRVFSLSLYMGLLEQLEIWAMFDFLLANLLPMKVKVRHEQDVGQEIHSFFPQTERLLGRTTSAHGRCSMYCLYPYMCKIVIIVICSLQFFPACTMFA